LLILLFTSCTSRPEPYSILEFTGKGEVYNYSKSLSPIIYESDSINSTALLACNGDIIMYGENNCFYYRESSLNKFLLKTINNTGFINEKINSISIPRNDDMIPWFKQMKSTDISALGYLYFDSLISESYIPYLTDLAETKPDIGLGYEGALKDMDKIFEIFKPRFIVGVTLSQKDFNLLSGLTNLEILSASLNDSIYTIPLPAMPKLKQLILAGIKKNAITSDDFLINNKQIERLTIMESGKFNFLFIKPLNSLKELIINGSDTIENFDLVRNHNQLELLSITGEKLSNDITLRELPDIRWMTFYEDATQDGFNSFIESHPDLEVVEIINNDTINSLSPLLNLRKFYGLIITDTITDFATIKSLKILKYLSLPDDVLNDSIKKAELQKSLPDTRIVANHGVCLGSGWLLLIIPLILVLRIFTQQISRKVQDKL
jgi:hypothetical protein